jgi:hypothetical protein
MTRRKREIIGLTNERDFPHLVELTFPPGGFRSVFLEIDAFHRERRIPVRRGRNRHEIEQFHIRLFLRYRHCGCIPQSLRWRVLDPRGYVVGCTGRETDRRQSAKATGPSHSIRAAMTRLYLLLCRRRHQPRRPPLAKRRLLLAQYSFNSLHNWHFEILFIVAIIIQLIHIVLEAL